MNTANLPAPRRTPAGEAGSESGCERTYGRFPKPHDGSHAHVLEPRHPGGPPSIVGGPPPRGNSEVDGFTAALCVAHEAHIPKNNHSTQRARTAHLPLTRIHCKRCAQHNTD
jgi:hypothetical protein